MDDELGTAHAAVRAATEELGDRWADRRQEIRAHGVHSGKLHPEFWSDFCDSGLMGLAVPREYGGSGGGLLALAVAMDTLAQRRLALVPAILTNLVANAIARAGGRDLKERYLPGIVSGQWIFCFPFTEPEAGHNAWRLETRARRDGDVITIDGRKSYISGADLCTRMLVMCRSLGDEDRTGAGTPPAYGFDAVIVDPAAPGITLANMNLGGVEGLNQFHVTFDRVRAASADLVGPEHQGMAAIFPSLNVERVLTSAVGVGTTDHLLGLSVRRATERVVFKATPIGRYQAIQHPLAELRARLEATRLLVYRAAAAFDADPEAPGVGGYANMAKVLSADLVCAATDQAVRTFGAAAFHPELGLTELLVDARILRSTPISQEMALNFVAEHVMGLPRSAR